MNQEDVSTNVMRVLSKIKKLKPKKPHKKTQITCVLDEFNKVYLLPTQKKLAKKIKKQNKKVAQ